MGCSLGIGAGASLWISMCCFEAALIVAGNLARSRLSSRRYPLESGYAARIGCPTSGPPLLRGRRVCFLALADGAASRVTMRVDSLRPSRHVLSEVNHLKLN